MTSAYVLYVQFYILSDLYAIPTTIGLYEYLNFLNQIPKCYNLRSDLFDGHETMPKYVSWTCMQSICWQWSHLLSF